jgi:hypothetical protein
MKIRKVRHVIDKREGWCFGIETTGNMFIVAFYKLFVCFYLEDPIKRIDIHIQKKDKKSKVETGWTIG